MLCCFFLIIACNQNAMIDTSYKVLLKIQKNDPNEVANCFTSMEEIGDFKSFIKDVDDGAKLIEKYGLPEKGSFVLASDSIIHDEKTVFIRYYFQTSSLDARNIGSYIQFEFYKDFGSRKIVGLYVNEDGVIPKIRAPEPHK